MNRLLHRTRNAFVIAALVLAGATASAEQVIDPADYLFDVMDQGAIVKNSNHTVSDWWYGCSITSAGMMMGYYDREGYGGKSYNDLVPGGTAEANVIGDTTQTSLVKDIIASREYQADFYDAGPSGSYAYDTGGGQTYGYGASGDDVASPRGAGDYNCLGDFMGTSQDAYGNVNGQTHFYYYARGNTYTGQKVDDAQIESWNYEDRSGMYGIMEYIEYSGYSVASIYNQYIDTELTALEKTNDDGFTFTDYMNEIDNGRLVMVHFEGHTMMGYGYDDATNEIYFRDTWDSEEEHIVWGGTFSEGSYSGAFKSVTVFELSGGGGAGTPEPATLILVLVATGAVLLHERTRRRDRTGA